MTAHVAEATEGKGRVVLRCSSWSPNVRAIEAAILVATAFQSEIELLFVEDSQRINFARFPFATEFSSRDGRARPVSATAVQAEMRAAFATARKVVASVAATTEVRVYEEFVRDDPIQALASACARRGPWNMIAIAETFGSPAPCALEDVFDTVSDATGVLIVGPGPSRRPSTRPSPIPSTGRGPANRPSSESTRRPAARGPRAGATDIHRTATQPVVVVLESIDRLQSMLRTARYIASAIEADVVILLAAETDDERARMDGEARLALGDQPGVHIQFDGALLDDHATIAEAIRRLDGGFVIAQFGGFAAPRGRGLRPLTHAVAAPVLLVR